MSGWKIVTLAEVGTFQAGVGFPLRLQGLTSGQFPFAKVGDISRVARAGKMDLATAENFVDQSTVQEMKVRPLPVGTILFAKIGEAIRQNFKVTTSTECLIDNNVMGLIPNKSRVEPRYLFHFLRSVDIYRLAEKTTVPSIRKSTLEKVPIPLPPLEEQKRIAGILDHAEELRVKRREAIAQLDTLTQAIFIEMFGDPATNPKKWTVKSVGELASKFSDGPFGSNLKTSHYTEVGIRVIRLQNIGIGEFLDKDKAYISSEHFAKLKKHECHPGDVLIGTLGDPNLRACIQPDSLALALNKADCVQLRANQEISHPAYICALLNQPAVERMAQEFIVGQTRLRISMGRLRMLKVPLPPLPLQQEFARRVEAVEKLKAAHRASLSELDALFASLQHRAFRGEL